ncbi:MAG: type II toxin-antitoxin system RelE/ParE family toxin [Nitrospirae bacterium]|nr:type II toxin-antitoxin system RelE/ParE family toxin [Nitrospirota bacterium]MDA1304270.1 type II toxin-antitoxin system RelE/ParE family toxin [Nitrospirota bacterium]
MVFDLRVRPEAEQDLAEAFRWYELQRSGLGHDFLHHVQAGFQFLERTPLVFPECYHGVRQHLIKRFPYKIFYKVEAQTVIVLAVVYGGRDPEWVKKRLQKS